MNDSSIGAQIMKFRKAADLTQEELGRAVGVSTQAVSRWECGGTPDVSLLPAIADRLHVTIDALFGREGGEVADFTRTLEQWLAAQPEKERLRRLCHQVWYMTQYVENKEILSGFSSDYLSSCEMNGVAGYTDEKLWVRTNLNLDQGLMLGIGAKDLSFISIFPQPEAGYEAFFAPREAYRAFFACLAMPGTLELLEYFFSEKARYYVPAVAAQRVGLPQDQVQAAMEAMEQANLLKKETLAAEGGDVDAYIIRDKGAYVPFLYFARWMMEHTDSYYMAWDTRETPYVCRKKVKENNEGQ